MRTRSKLYDGDCSRDNGDSDSCLNAFRALAVPSLGVRLRLGGFAGMRQASIALAPSVGLALGLEQENRPHAPVTTWALFAPGLTASFGPGELRFRVEVPRGELTTPTFDVAFGFVF